ncbi:hypothetical protein Vadar_030821 [Vaccinium darrowii]|uniref:Uncharacterized protein n=1 Tax=Vaccinium darrowii TaxID=229202 RepID=A0ACB7YB87_9ERIC|nr:hypothetical protein Vadar_030821 [Vaccinium darrowii]
MVTLLLTVLDLSRCDRGAYMFLPLYMMRTHAHALNTKWRVNKRVFGVIDTLADLVDREDVPLLEEPDADDGAEIKKWKRKVKAVKKDRDEDGFFYPHNLDFCGRAYPMHPHLNHLGSDLCRGILEFSEGHRPLEGKHWWLGAEEPFQCLGACINLAEALRSSSPETTISQMPIHQETFSYLHREWSRKMRNIICAKVMDHVMAYSTQCIETVKSLKTIAGTLPPLTIPSDGKRVLQTDASDQFWGACCLWKGQGFAALLDSGVGTVSVNPIANDVHVEHYTTKFDTIELEKIVENVSELPGPELDAVVREAFDVANNNIYAFHAAQKLAETSVESTKVTNREAGSSLCKLCGGILAQLLSAAARFQQLQLVAFLSMA